MVPGILMALVLIGTFGLWMAIMSFLSLLVEIQKDKKDLIILAVHVGIIIILTSFDVIMLVKYGKLC